MNNRLLEAMENNFIEILEDRSGFTVVQEGVVLETFRTYGEAASLVRDITGLED